MADDAPVLGGFIDGVCAGGVAGVLGVAVVVPGCALVLPDGGVGVCAIARPPPIATIAAAAIIVFLLMIGSLPC